MFSKAIVRFPAPNYADGLTKALLSAPDYNLALRQHSAYCEALKRCGLELILLEADERYPDSTFVEDTAVVMQEGVIFTRPGAASRAGEVITIKETLSRSRLELGSIHEPGTLDGGDVCEAGNHFFIGISDRSNDAGVQQLGSILECNGYTSTFIDVRNVKSILHLKSGLTYLGDNRLVVIDALANCEEVQKYELVRVDTIEAYAANCVRVNDYVLVAAGYPGFERTLKDLGYRTITLQMSEFEKMDGGLSCLSLRF